MPFTSSNRHKNHRGLLPGVWELCHVCTKCMLPLPLSRRSPSRMCQMPFFRGKVEKGSAWSASQEEMHLWPSVGKKAPLPTAPLDSASDAATLGLAALGPYEPSRLDFCDKKKRSPSPPACPTRGGSSRETSNKKRESGPAPTRGQSDKCQPSEGSSCPAPSQPF